MTRPLRPWPMSAPPMMPSDTITTAMSRHVTLRLAVAPQQPPAASAGISDCRTNSSTLFAMPSKVERSSEASSLSAVPGPGRESEIRSEGTARQGWQQVAQTVTTMRIVGRRSRANPSSGSSLPSSASAIASLPSFSAPDGDRGGPACSLSASSASGASPPASMRHSSSSPPLVSAADACPVSPGSPGPLTASLSAFCSCSCSCSSSSSSFSSSSIWAMGCDGLIMSELPGLMNVPPAARDRLRALPGDRKSYSSRACTVMEPLLEGAGFRKVEHGCMWRSRRRSANTSLTGEWGVRRSEPRGGGAGPDLMSVEEWVVEVKTDAWVTEAQWQRSTTFWYSRSWARCDSGTRSSVERFCSSKSSRARYMACRLFSSALSSVA